MDLSSFGLGIEQNGDIFISRFREGKWHGGRKPVTNEFLTLMLLKFEPNVEYSLDIGGKPAFSLLIQKINQVPEEHPAQIRLFKEEAEAGAEDAVDAEVMS